MSLTNLTKTTGVLVALVKSAASLVNATIISMKASLLKEDGFYLLQETGDRIILEESSGTLTNLTKTSA